MTIQLMVGLEPPLKMAPGGLSKEADGMRSRSMPSLHKEGEAGTIEAALDMVRHEEELQLKPLQQQYTSLRDLIAALPTRRGRVQDVEWCGAEEPKFKDKLLKLAARAYLQPIVRKPAPQAHFIAQCWIKFASTNKSMVVGIIEGLQRQADACVKFLRTQAFILVQRFKSQQHTAFLQ